MLRCTFIGPTELTLVTNLGQDDDPIEDIREYAAGDVLEFTLVDHPERFIGKDFVEDKKLWNIQLADGSMVFCVDPTWFVYDSDSVMLYL